MSLRDYVVFLLVGQHAYLVGQRHVDHVRKLLDVQLWQLGLHLPVEHQLVRTLTSGLVRCSSVKYCAVQWRIEDILWAVCIQQRRFFRQYSGLAATESDTCPHQPVPSIHLYLGGSRQ